MIQLSVNGRFLSRNITGVDRVSHQLLTALIADKRFLINLFVPANAPDDSTLFGILGAGVDIRRGRFSGYFWEQVELPAMAFNKNLLSPANLGPIFKKKHYLILHDVQALSHPQSYSFRFRSVYKLLLPLLGRSVKNIFTVSFFSKRQIVNYRVGSESKIHVIQNSVEYFNAVDMKKYNLQDQYIRPGAYYLCVGSSAPHKNLQILEDIFSKRRRCLKYPLVIVGDRDPKIFKVPESRISDNIHYTGRVSDGELKYLYKNAFAFLFPSLTEGFGLPVLEAMVSGCPVIASTGGAIPEVCGTAAILCPPTEPKEWVKVLKNLESKHTMRENLVNLGKKQSEQFSVTDSLDTIHRVLSANENL